MQATTEPAWLTLYRRVREDLAWPPEPPRLHHRVLYTIDRDGHFIRLKNVLGAKRGAAASANEPWLHDRYPLDAGSWRLPVPVIPELKARYPYDPFAAVVAAPTATPARGWAGALRGWAAGALLLALLVLLVRAAEKCLDRRLFHMRRRESDEWPTPSVLATIQQGQGAGSAGSAGGAGDVEAQRDAPPPYALCVGKPRPHEAPPPYSACLLPAARDARTQDDEACCSQDVTNNVESNTELVFENGRVVERKDTGQTNEPHDVTKSEDTAADNNDVTEPEDTAADNNDVTEPEDTAADKNDVIEPEAAADNATRERVVFV